MLAGRLYVTRKEMRLAEKKCFSRKEIFLAGRIFISKKETFWEEMC